MTRSQSRLVTSGPNSSSERRGSLVIERVDCGLLTNMADPIPVPVTRDDFDAAALSGWTWVDGELPALVAGFLAESYSGAAAFALEVARASDAAVHHPDIDIRYQRHARVTLTTHGTGGVSDLDLTLAATISSLATEHGVAAEADIPR